MNNFYKENNDSIIRKIFKDFSHHKMVKEFNRYTISSTFVFILDLLLLIILTEIFGIFYLFSAGISIIISFTINYFVNINWVFADRKYSGAPTLEYFLMIAISLFVSVINFIAIWFLSDILLFYYVFSKLIASALTFVLKFFLRKIILF
mgnify:FL=1|tara:strand:+ start:4529 stop:4975 length:447 start_codon:yes stop_codon:yes gene_type:complete